MAASFRAILLDFDGTLVDSEPLHHEAWSAAVAPHGASVSWEDYQRRFVGQTDRWAARVLLSEAGRPLEPALLEEVRLAKHAYFRDFAAVRFRVSPGVVDLVKKAATIVRLGVVSSSLRLDVLPALERAGFADLLAACVFGEDVSRHKPDPEPYLLALERLREAGPLLAAETLVFEDSTSGLASARAAGMQTVQVAHAAELEGLLEAALEGARPPSS